MKCIPARGRNRAKRDFQALLTEFPAVSHRSVSYLLIAANSASLACKAARQVELSRAGEGDAFLVLVVMDKLSGNNPFLISAFLSHDD